MSSADTPSASARTSTSRSSSAPDGFALWSIDPATGDAKRLPLGKELGGAAVGAAAVWVIRGDPATLLRIDPRSERVTRIPIAQRLGPIQPFPIGVAVGAPVAGPSGVQAAVDST